MWLYLLGTLIIIILVTNYNTFQIILNHILLIQIVIDIYSYLRLSSIFTVQHKACKVNIITHVES